MFWKDAPRLGSLSLASKVAISLFLVLAGIGYIFGFLNIVVTYQMTDGESGLSVKDVELVYYGSREGTALEGSIDGSMRSYFSSDSNYDATKEWIQQGADPDTYAPIQAIFDNDCVACHNSAGYAAADVVLEQFSDLEPLLKQDTGKSVNRLISLSHTHLLSTLVVVFIMMFIFSFSSFPDWLKFVGYVLPMFAIALDIGSWWLAKVAPGFAVLVIIGGAALGTSFAALTVLGLWDLWFGKKE